MRYVKMAKNLWLGFSCFKSNSDLENWVKVTKMISFSRCPEVIFMQNGKNTPSMYKI